MSKKHHAYISQHKLHFDSRGREEGACLVKHQKLIKIFEYTPKAMSATEGQNPKQNMARKIASGIKDGNDVPLKDNFKHKLSSSCSYRAQAAYRAKQSDWSRYRDYNSNTATSKWFKDGSTPFTNEAHHLIPDGSIVEAVDELVNGNYTEKRLVVGALLKAKYNVHHHVNMMILPRIQDDGCALGLPTHINNHKRYSGKVKDDVYHVMSGLVKPKIVDEKCVVDDKDAGLCVKKLRQMSDNIHAWVLGEVSQEVHRRCKNNSGSNLEDISIDKFTPPGL